MASADFARQAQEKVDCSSNASTADVTDLGAASLRSGSEVDATDLLEHVNVDGSLRNLAVPQSESLPSWPLQPVQEQGIQAARPCGAFVLVPMAALQQQLQAGGFVVGQTFAMPQAWGVAQPAGPQWRSQGRKKERRGQREDRRIESAESNHRYVPPHRRQAGPMEASDFSTRRRYDRRVCWPERPKQTERFERSRREEQRSTARVCWAERPNLTGWREEPPQSGHSMECELGQARWPWPKMPPAASSEELAEQQEGVEMLLAALLEPAREKPPSEPAVGTTRIATAAVDKLRQCLVEECTGGSAPPQLEAADQVFATSRRRLPPPPAGRAPVPPEDPRLSAGLCTQNSSVLPHLHFAALSTALRRRWQLNSRLQGIDSLARSHLHGRWLARQLAGAVRIERHRAGNSGVRGDCPYFGEEFKNEAIGSHGSLPNP